MQSLYIQIIAYLGSFLNSILKVKNVSKRPNSFKHSLIKDSEKLFHVDFPIEIHMSHKWSRSVLKECIYSGDKKVPKSQIWTISYFVNSELWDGL